MSRVCLRVVHNCINTLVFTKYIHKMYINAVHVTKLHNQDLNPGTILLEIPKNSPVMSQFDSVASHLAIDAAPQDIPVLAFSASTNCSKPAVVALDFGTAQSGIAWALTENHEHVHFTSPGWHNQKGETVLLAKDDGTFKFGEEARYEYVSKQYDADPSAWENGERLGCTGKLLERFKQEVNRKANADAGSAFSMLGGDTIPLMKLVVETYAFLKATALEFVRHSNRDKCREEDIQWVVTLPTGWSASGKAFLREAATQAGVSGPDVLFLDETVAACVSALVHPPTPVSKALVVSAGYHTLDLAVCEVLEADPALSFRILAQHNAVLDGHRVDTNFETFLADLLGEEYYQPNTNYWVFQEIRRDFERSKRSFTPERLGLNIRILPATDDRKEALACMQRYNTRHPERALVMQPFTRQGFICPTKELMLSLLEPCLATVVNEVRSMLSQHPDVATVILTGGFGGCGALLQRLQAELPQEVRVVRADKTETAVADGAVHYAMHRVTT